MYIAPEERPCQHPLAEELSRDLQVARQMLVKSRDFACEWGSFFLYFVGFQNGYRRRSKSLSD
jgi:hypothetical protein